MAGAAAPASLSSLTMKTRPVSTTTRPLSGSTSGTMTADKSDKRRSVVVPLTFTTTAGRAPPSSVAGACLPLVFLLYSGQFVLEHHTDEKAPGAHLVFFPQPVEAFRFLQDRKIGPKKGRDLPRRKNIVAAARTSSSSSTTSGRSSGDGSSAPASSTERASSFATTSARGIKLHPAAAPVLKGKTDADHVDLGKELHQEEDPQEVRLAVRGGGGPLSPSSNVVLGEAAQEEDDDESSEGGTRKTLEATSSRVVDTQSEQATSSTTSGSRSTSFSTSVLELQQNEGSDGSCCGDLLGGTSDGEANNSKESSRVGGGAGSGSEAPRDDEDRLDSLGISGEESYAPGDIVIDNTLGQGANLYAPVDNGEVSETLSISPEAKDWMEEVGGDLETCNALHLWRHPQDALNVILAPSGFRLRGHPDFKQNDPVYDETARWEQTVRDIYFYTIQHRPFNPRDVEQINYFFVSAAHPWDDDHFCSFAPKEKPWNTLQGQWSDLQHDQFMCRIHQHPQYGNATENAIQVLVTDHCASKLPTIKAIMLIQNLREDRRDPDYWHAGMASSLNSIGYMTRNPYYPELAKTQDAEVFVHELSHVWFALADEYNYAVSMSNPNEYDNCDNQGCEKWQDLIDADLPNIGCYSDRCFDKNGDGKGEYFASSEKSLMLQHGSTADFGPQAERIICCKYLTIFATDPLPRFCAAFTNYAKGLDLLDYCENRVNTQFMAIPHIQKKVIPGLEGTTSASAASSFASLAVLAGPGADREESGEMNNKLDTSTGAAAETSENTGEEIVKQAIIINARRSGRGRQPYEMSEEGMKKHRQEVKTTSAVMQGTEAVTRVEHYVVRPIKRKLAMVMTKNTLPAALEALEKELRVPEAERNSTTGCPATTRTSTATETSETSTEDVLSQCKIDFVKHSLALKLDKMTKDLKRMKRRRIGQFKNRRYNNPGEGTGGNAPNSERRARQWRQLNTRIQNKELNRKILCGIYMRMDAEMILGRWQDGRRDIVLPRLKAVETSRQLCKDFTKMLPSKAKVEKPGGQMKMLSTKKFSDHQTGASASSANADDRDGVLADEDSNSASSPAEQDVEVDDEEDAVAESSAGDTSESSSVDKAASSSTVQLSDDEDKNSTSDEDEDDVEGQDEGFVTLMREVVSVDIMREVRAVFDGSSTRTARAQRRMKTSSGGGNYMKASDEEIPMAVPPLQESQKEQRSKIRNTVDFDKQGARFATADERLFPNGILAWEVVRTEVVEEGNEAGKGGNEKDEQHEEKTRTSKPTQLSHTCRLVPERKNLRTGEPVGPERRYGSYPYAALYGEDVESCGMLGVEPRGAAAANMEINYGCVVDPVAKVVPEALRRDRKYLKLCIRKKKSLSTSTDGVVKTSDEEDPKCEANNAYQLTFWQERYELLEHLRTDSTKNVTTEQLQQQGKNVDKHDTQHGEVMRIPNNQIPVLLDQLESCEVLEVDQVLLLESTQEEETQTYAV
ncbi:unnamed protein product [Amoebophrya sp. A120]|nr:unnamed protein product [Amoebophrya sp. A120]|eukprot:GSA120T00007209001.1